MSKYEYICPTEQGFKRVYFTKAQHNEIFPNRPTKWTKSYEYYIDDKKLIVHQFDSKLIVLLNVLLFPVNVLYAGFMNFGELIDEYKRTFKPKKYGSFIPDAVWNEGLTTAKRILNES